MMTTLIAGGGTGGHIYPGIAIARELLRRDQANRVVFVGTARGLETRIVPQEGFELRLIRVSALKGMGARGQIDSLLTLLRSLPAVWRLLRELAPQLVIGVGGYSSGPVVLMAALLGIPTMIAEQNALPGLTNRLLARFVDAAAVSFEEALGFFRKHGLDVELTGNPVRADFFAIPPRTGGGRLNLLITGGSQGARAINEAMIAALPHMRSLGDRLRITHQTGVADFERVRDACLAAGVTAEVSPFIDRMVEQFEAADLIICRAGATTVAELAAAGRPALLIPFPLAADDHQRRNAEAVERAGGGRLIPQSELTGQRLADEIVSLLADPARLRNMAESIRRLSHPQAASRLVELGLRITGNTPNGK